MSAPPRRLRALAVQLGPNGPGQRGLNLDVQPAGASAAASSCAAATATAPAPGSLGDYADLYLRTSYDLTHVFLARELDKVGAAAHSAATKVRAGGRIRSRIGTPHLMWGGCCAADVPGNPNIAPEPQVGFEGAAGGMDRDAGVGELGAGDVLLAAQPRPAILAAAERGCMVIGLGYPMVTDRYSPPQFNDFPDPPFMDTDVCDVFLYSWAPKEDGVVTPALTPGIKILPTSPQIAVAYWALTAQIATDLAPGGESRAAGDAAAAAELYLRTLMGRLSELHRGYLGAIHTAGQAIAERVLRGGRWAEHRHSRNRQICSQLLTLPLPPIRTGCSTGERERGAPAG